MSSPVLVLTTLPLDADVEAFAATLVEDRLAACVNVFGEMQSFYRWEGQVQQDAERQVFIKTDAARLALLWERLQTLHPYDVPEFVVLPITDGSDAYLKWLAESTAEEGSEGAAG